MTTKNTLLFLCIGLIFELFTFSTVRAQAPSWDWAIRSGGNMEEAGMQVVADSAGSVYGWGVFNSPSIQFGSHTLANPGSQSGAYYLVKYDAAGNAQWAKTYSGYMNINGIVPAPGHLYVYGQFAITLTAEGTTITHDGIGQQQYIMKYTPAGHLVWIKRIGGIHSQNRTRIFQMEALDENHLVAWGDADNDTLGNAPVNYTQWLGKLDTSGQFGTVKTLGGCIGTGHDPMSHIEPKDIVVDKNHAVYLCGVDEKNASIHTANWQLDTLSGEGVNKAFIARFGQNLDFAWSKMIYTNLSSYGMSNVTKAAVDHQNNIYLLGHAQSATIWFDQTHVHSTTPRSTFLVKYAPDGNILWDTVMAQPVTPPVGLYPNITTDKVGNLYYAGNFYGPYSFGDTAITADGGSNLFVVKFNAAGHRQWIRQNTLGALAFLNDMAEDGRGNLYLTGRLAYSNSGAGSAGFGNTTLNVTPPVPGSYAADLFIAKLGNCTASPTHISPQTPQTLCHGDSIVLSASGAQEYIWTTGATTPAVTVTHAGTYGVFGVAASGCYGSSAPVNVTTATVDVDVTTVQNTFTAHAVNAVYQWAVCQNNALQPIPGATSQNYTATQAGSYAVIVTQGGCTDTSACHALVLGSGIAAATADQPDITLFPNPNAGDFSVNIAGGNGLAVTMSIWDVSGKKQLEEKLTGSMPAIQAGHIPAGIYQVRFTVNGTPVKSCKMVVVK